MKSNNNLFSLSLRTLIPTGGIPSSFRVPEVGRKNTGRDSIAVIFAVNYISFSKVIYLLILELKIPVENKTLCDRIKKKGF